MYTWFDFWAPNLVMNLWTGVDWKRWGLVGWGVRVGLLGSLSDSSMVEGLVSSEMVVISWNIFSFSS